jgi:transposase
MDKRYPSDLTDAEWELLEPLLFKLQGSDSLGVIPCGALNGIFYTYVLKEACEGL